MEPKKHSTRDGRAVANVTDTPEDVYVNSFLEDGESGFVTTLEPDTMPEADARIEALKRAIDIAKLMSNVTVDDIINIASTVYDYIRNTEI